MAEPKNFTGWKVVVLSFIGAATFWFFSALGKEYNYRFNHPIEFIYDRDSLIEVDDLPTYVDIDVSGLGWDLFKVSFWFGSDPVIFELDNPAAIRYLTRPTILPILTDQLDEFSINFLFTDTLYIDIDRKTSKLVKLEIDSVHVDLEQDYRIVSSIDLGPDTARIFGPTSFLDTLDQSLTIDLNEREIDYDFDEFIRIGLLDAYDIYAAPPTVNVTFEVEKFERLEIPTEIEMINFPEDSSVFVTNPEVTVKFVVRESLLEDYFASDFKIIADYSMISTIDSMVSAIVVFHPENVLEVEVVPDSLSITYAE